MRILLISAHRTELSRWGKKLQDLQPLYLSLGLAYVAAAAEQTSATVRVLDFNATPFNEIEFKKFLLDFRPDIIGIQILVMTYGSAKMIASIAKKTLPETKIVFGGPLASVREKVLLDECEHADMVVVGEGDVTFPALINTLDKGEDLGGVSGICYRKDGTAVYNGYRYPVPDLDEIPFPARNLFPLSKYRFSPMMLGNRTMDLITSRGCPFSCNFCHSQALSPTFRNQSPHKTIEEIKMLKSDFNVDSLMFHDDIMTANKKITHDLCDLIIKENLVMPWSCLTHVNCLSEELLIKMKAAGCYQIWLGVESGNQRLLDFLNKQSKLETVRKAFAMCNKHRIMTRALFIIGLPGETREETKQTVKFCIEIKPTFAQFSVASPLKGTVMYQQMIDTSLGLGRVVELDDDNYDFYTNVVYIPEGRTVDEVRASHRQAYKSFYLRLSYVLYILPYISKFPMRNIFAFLKTAVKLLLIR